MHRKRTVAITLLIISIAFFSLIIQHSLGIAYPGDLGLVSVSSDGDQASNLSINAKVSADGTHVTFESSASNLVPGDINGNNDIFVHDRDTGNTVRVSVATGGEEANSGSSRPSISSNGRYITFVSAATNLVAGDTNGKSDIFLHDLVTGVTTRISNGIYASQSNNTSAYPSISSDGAFITFKSLADNLVPDDTNGTYDIFVYEVNSALISRVSVSSGGIQANGSSDWPSISADGRYIAFESNADNLVPGDMNNFQDIFVHDRLTGQTTRVSILPGGAETNESSQNPSISGNGNFIVYGSWASNLVDGDTNGYQDIFVYDMGANQTTGITALIEGIPSNSYSSLPSISADGNYVSFASVASNLVPNDTNSNEDIFIYDVQAGSNSILTKAWDASSANGYSSLPSISGDGSFVVFHSSANNLVPDDLNGNIDVFAVETFANFVEPSPTPSDDYSWLVMFYLSADIDDAVGDSYGKIMNYIENGAQNSDVKIVVLWDQFGEGNAAYYEIIYDEDLNTLAEYEENVTKWNKNEVNMGDPTTLSDFVIWGMDNYPATHYALVMDDHGSGLGGSMLDQTSGNDSLTLLETKTALTDVGSAQNKIDVLVMNACLMGLVENGYEFKDVADYYVSSEDIQWTYSQGYTDTLNQISSASDVLDGAKAFVDGYADEQVSKGNYYSLSVANLSQAEGLKSAIETLAGDLNTSISTNAPDLWSIRENLAQKFPSQSLSGNSTEYYVDLYDYAQLVYDNFSDPVIKADAQNLMSTVEDYVVYNRSSHTKAHGVSIFFPDMKSSYYTGDNNDFANGTVWDIGGGSSYPEARSTGPIVWGNLLANIFSEVDPGGLDDALPLEPQPKATYLEHFLPLIIK